MGKNRTTQTHNSYSLPVHVCFLNSFFLHIADTWYFCDWTLSLGISLFPQEEALLKEILCVKILSIYCEVDFEVKFKLFLCLGSRFASKHSKN